MVPRWAARAPRLTNRTARWVMLACECAVAHQPKRIVLTGGPGAGKTAVLELIRQAFCEHVVVLPEAAGVLFGGGFPRGSHEISRRAAQRAIYYVQRELEASAVVEQPAIILCDRGTIDGAAYGPAPEISGRRSERRWLRSSVGTRW